MFPSHVPQRLYATSSFASVQPVVNVAVSAIIIMVIME